MLSHLPFATVLHNGVLTQLNQNGNFEETVTDAVTAFNEAAYTRVLVPGDSGHDRGPCAAGADAAGPGRDIILSPEKRCKIMSKLLRAVFRIRHKIFEISKTKKAV